MKNFLSKKILLVTFMEIISITSEFNKTYYRSYKCQGSKCSRTFYPLEQPPSDEKFNLSRNQIEHSTLAACRLSCDPYAALWPVPTGSMELGYRYASIHPSQFAFDLSSVPQEAKKFANEMNNIFLSNLRRFLKKGKEHWANNSEIYNHINVFINVNSSDLTLDWFTNESYNLEINFDESATPNIGRVEISANTIYGARHGMETLLQLTAPVIKTGGHKGLVILKSAMIKDAPVFAHRGLSLDTSRNFVPVNNILKTIDGLSSCKMNILHWHATDSQSFPIEIKRVPAMTLYGAYSPEEIYTTEDLRLIVSYAKSRGVRVIIELDAPAHSGAGWEWGEEAGLGSLAVCVNSQPWRYFCIQPPCGQLNPVNPNLYNVLGDIYKDLIDVWGPEEVFHMGGDEIFIPCWNSTKVITDSMESRGMGLTHDDFLKLWSDYQAKLLRIVDEERSRRSVGVSNVSAILWTSELTNPSTIEKYVDKNRYVIQTWVPSGSPIPNELLNKGYRIIVTTKNAWYLDHGVWGNTKYYAWRTVYLNRIPKEPGVLGGEVAMWGEYVDGRSFDPKIWPRTAAAAERLWSNPSTISTAEAEPRLHGHRDRLTTRGIRPDPIAPEWCAQHDGQCD